MQQHYNHSRRRVLRRRRIMVIAAAILLVAAVVFAVVHWVIPALNKPARPDARSRNRSDHRPKRHRRCYTNAESGR